MRGRRQFQWYKLLAPIVRPRMSSTRPTHIERTQQASRSDEVSAVTVQEVAQLSPTVKRFTLRAENCKLTFKPGQWVDLHIPTVDTVGGYSITTAPHQLQEEGLFGLAIQQSTHPPTLWMTTQCCAGDRLSVRVGGDFVYDPTPSQSHDLILIGGGVGINPLLSMLLHHARLLELGNISGKVALLYSASSTSELLFKEKIDDLCSQHSWFNAQYFVTRQHSTSPQTNSTVFKRRINQTDVSTHVSSLSVNSSAVTSYVCGPPDMIDCASEWLRGCGVEHIHTEKW